MTDLENLILASITKMVEANHKISLDDGGDQAFLASYLSKTVAEQNKMPWSNSLDDYHSPQSLAEGSVYLFKKIDYLNGELASFMRILLGQDIQDNIFEIAEECSSGKGKIELSTEVQQIAEAVEHMGKALLCLDYLQSYFMKRYKREEESSIIAQGLSTEASSHSIPDNDFFYDPNY